NNYRRIAQTVADVAREVPKPVAFFNTAAGGMHALVLEPFADSPVAVMQGARARLLAISRLLAYSRFAPAAEPAALAPAAHWRDRLATGRPLTERESKAFLAAHGIPVTRETCAPDASAAVKAATEIGYPVVLKIDSPDLPHKTEAGGVRIGLSDAAAVEAGGAPKKNPARRRRPAAPRRGVVGEEKEPDA